MISELMERIKSVAAEYYRVTGKPLGVTGEVGEYECAKALGLTLCDARQAGYDAIGSDGRKVQIKARVLPDGKARGGQRVGGIRSEHEFDTVALILMTHAFDVTGVYEVDRRAIEIAIQKPGSKARNERGALAVSQFIRLSKEAADEANLCACGCGEPTPRTFRPGHDMRLLFATAKRAGIKAELRELYELADEHGGIVEWAKENSVPT